MTKKRCSKCGKNRALKFYNKKGDGLTARCKKCLSEDWTKAYADNPTRRQQVKDAVGRYKAEIFRFLASLKHMKPCTDCGVSYPYYVMDFDHCRGKKVLNLASAQRVCLSKKKILAEIAKCDLVCSNCHRERTHGGIAQAVERTPDKR